MNNKKYLALRYFCMTEAEKAAIREEFGPEMLAELDDLVSQFPVVPSLDRETLSDILKQQLLGLKSFSDSEVAARQFWLGLLKSFKSRDPNQGHELKLCLERCIH